MSRLEPLEAVAVIPARYASQRFPGKPLAPIAGEPMVVRVLRNAADASTVARVLVATDDERIAEVVRAAGGLVAMTSPLAPSGTDRVWEAVQPVPAEVVVNVQGDEPLLPGAVIDALVGRLAEGGADIATPVISVPRSSAHRPDTVTVACDEAMVAHYFSRSTIPSRADPVWQHVGVYAFRREALARFVATPPTALERAEGLEQLRALSLGLRIVAVPVDAPLHAVDRPEDVAVVERMLAGETGTAGATQAVDVRLLVLDVDGVLTDGRISYAGEGAEQALQFDVKDGYGIVSLVRAGVEVAILSARDSEALRRRAKELGIREVRAGVTDKAAEIVGLSRDLDVPLSATCYVGDDDPDVPVMALTGTSAAPVDASSAARTAATIRLDRPGGRGAVRELADRLLAGRSPSGVS